MIFHVCRINFFVLWFKFLSAIHFWSKDGVMKLTHSELVSDWSVATQTKPLFILSAWPNESLVSVNDSFYGFTMSQLHGIAFILVRSEVLQFVLSWRWQNHKKYARSSCSWSDASTCIDSIFLYNCRNGPRNNNSQFVLTGMHVLSFVQCEAALVSGSNCTLLSYVTLTESMYKIAS